MEIQLSRVVMMVCIGIFEFYATETSFGLTYVELSQIVPEEIQENGVRVLYGNPFQNFFNSIAQGEVGKMKQEVTREQRTFDTMREELHVARNENTIKKRNFYQKYLADKNSVPAKRETEIIKENHIGRFDIRVGKIVSAEMHPDEKFFYVVMVDLGEKELRKMALPIAKHVTLEELRDRMALFLANKKMFRITAQEGKGSIFHASKFGEIDILVPPKTAVPGDRVTVEGYEREPDEQINTKIDPSYEHIMEDMKTNEKKEAMYRGELLNVAGKGPATASKMANTRVYTV